MIDTCLSSVVFCSLTVMDFKTYFTIVALAVDHRDLQLVMNLSLL